ncbi:MAG: GreA/GreB family elongation factor [Vulcanimicrobiaceae bacterium]
MSRAFMKELEDAPEPKLVTSQRPRPMTPAAFRALEAALAAEKDEERSRALRDELDDAVIVNPPEDRSVVAFGAHVAVTGDDGKEQRFTIVGEHEMDVAKGRITDASPLGIALVGARVGDRVMWKRPVGNVQLTINSIRYD